MALFAGAHSALLVGIAALIRTSAIRDALSVDELLGQVKPFSVVRVTSEIKAHPVHDDIATVATTIPADTEGVVLEVAEPRGDAVVDFKDHQYMVKRDDFGKLETLLTSSADDLTAAHPEDTQQDKLRRLKLHQARQQFWETKTTHLLTENDALLEENTVLVQEVLDLQQEYKRAIAELLKSKKQELKSNAGNHESPM